MIASGCGKENKEDKALDITGQWELIDIQTKAAQIGDAAIEVYIEFKEDNTFSMWQMLGVGRHEKMSGTWTLTGNVLNGKYSDNKDWGTGYNVSIESDNLYMTEMKTGSEVCVYGRCTIPSDLK